MTEQYKSKGEEEKNGDYTRIPRHEWERNG
jgi:hypothetical protein